MLKIVEDDLLDQDVEAIVNAWSRSTITWWLLVSHGLLAPLKGLPNNPLALPEAI